MADCSNGCVTQSVDMTQYYIPDKAQGPGRNIFMKNVPHSSHKFPVKEMKGRSFRLL